jgi:flagellar basal-body rod protein FlgF/flagellar basal-body rod protein FlgG
LQSQSGEPVLNTENQPIQLPLGKVAISSDGTVSVDNNIVARIGVVDLPGATLVPEGATNFAVQGGTIRPATNSSVRQGMLESANLSPVAASVGLITIQRYADMMFRTLNIFHTEFNKSAAEDLPRV